MPDDRRRSKSRGRAAQGGTAGPAGSHQRRADLDHDRRDQGRAGAGGSGSGQQNNGRGRSRSRSKYQGRNQGQNWWPKQQEWPQQKSQDWHQPAAPPAAAAAASPHAWAIPGYYKYKEEATQLKKKLEEMEAASSPRGPSMFTQGMSSAFQYLGMRPPNPGSSPSGFETQQAAQPMGGFPPLPPMPPMPPAFQPGQPPVMFPPP